MIESFRSWWSSASVDDVADDAKTLSKLGSIISSINATKDLRYLVEIIMKTKNLTYRLAAKFIEAVLNRLNELSGDDEKQKSAENLVFYNCCTSLKQCVNFYAIVTKLSLEKNIYKNQESSDGLTSTSVAEILFVEEGFLVSLCRDLDDNLLVRDSNRSENEFDKSVINLSSFLSYIDVMPSHCQTSTDADDGPTLAVRLSTKLTDEELTRFGRKICLNFLFSDDQCFCLLPFRRFFVYAVFDEYQFEKIRTRISSVIRLKRRRLDFVVVSFLVERSTFVFRSSATFVRFILGNFFIVRQRRICRKLFNESSRRFNEQSSYGRMRLFVFSFTRHR